MHNTRAGKFTKCITFTIACNITVLILHGHLPNVKKISLSCDAIPSLLSFRKKKYIHSAVSQDKVLTKALTQVCTAHSSSIPQSTIHTLIYLSRYDLPKPLILNRHKIKHFLMHPGRLFTTLEMFLNKLLCMLHMKTLIMYSVNSEPNQTN